VINRNSFSNYWTITHYSSCYVFAKEGP